MQKFMQDTTGWDPLIRHYVAGGTESGGGIGRLVSYVLAARNPRFRHEVVDTRGPSWRPMRSVPRLFAAMAVIADDARSGRTVLHHFHIAGRGSTARKLVLGTWARMLGAPYVLHLHDYAYAEDLARRPAWQFDGIRALFLGAEQVIVLGKRDFRTVKFALGVPEDRITILRNCVPDPGPRPALAAARRGEVRILFLGQLGPRKGVPELLQALADPALPHTGWTATLAGDGPVDQYRAEAARLGLGSRVHLTGWVDADRAAALRAQADILVLPSHAEGFAMAVLEGLAQGLAVVTTPVGAHDEVLIDGRNSLLVPPGNAGALANALDRLIRDPALRARIGAEGRRLYLSGFGIDGYLNTLEKLLAGHLRGALPAPRSA